MSPEADAIRVDLPAETDTERLAVQIADCWKAAPDLFRSLWLSGELGAGKTTLARALLRRLGVEGQVRSPTFAIVERYDVPAGDEIRPIFHVDLYRLSDPGQVPELGLIDELEAGGFLIIEWPEHGAGVLGPPDVEVGMSYDGNGRRATLRASTPGLRQALNPLRL